MRLALRSFVVILLPNGGPFGTVPELLFEKKGFKRVTFFGDETVGEYGSLSLWESKEDAEAAAAVIGPKLQQAVSGIAKEPPTRRFFEVYEPKA